MKLKFEDKIEIVRLYEEEHLSFNSIAKKYNVQTSIINNLIRKYKEHGVESLKHPAKNRTYSPDFKLMIITKVYNGHSEISLAAKYNLPGAGTISMWMKKYNELGYNGFKSKPKGKPKSIMSPAKKENNVVNNSTPLTESERAKYEELIQRNKELEMENDLLKKLNALVQ